jgi:phosphohistidine phosphatase
MKKMIFVRHGKAEEHTGSNGDYERSLTAKGKTVSAKMACLLKKKMKDPYVLVTSPAFRAYETAAIFARILGYDTGKIVLRQSLYSPATLRSFAEITGELDEKISTVIFFGHNPSFTEIPDLLSMTGCDIVPKSGIVSLSFKTDTWKEVFREKGSVDFFLKPDATI